jgi:hypothetical protein
MISFQLHEKVIRYLQDEIEIEQLEEWLAPRLSDFFQIPDSSDARVVSTIELGLAEMGDGILSLEEFHIMLSEELQKEIFTVLEAEPINSVSITGSSNQSNYFNAVTLERHSSPTIIVAVPELFGCT